MSKEKTMTPRNAKEIRPTGIRETRTGKPAYCVEIIMLYTPDF